MSASWKRAGGSAARPQARTLTGLLIGAGTALISGCIGAAKTQKETPAPVPVVASPAVLEQTEKAPPRAAIVVEGSGKFVGVPSGPAIPGRAAGEGYQLSFVDAEIGNVVASVIGDGLGLPYVVDPQVKGTMTLQAARPLSRAEVLPALEAALNVHGIALVEANGTYQVVPMRDAPRRIGWVRGPGQTSGAGFAVQIVPVKYVSAADIEKVLRPFAPEGGILRIDEARNLLVLAGTSRDLAVMRDVIDTFDVNWLTGMSFALYPVEYVDAKTLVEELSNVFADARSPIGNIVRLVPLSRINSLMVVTHEASYLKEVERWIKRLDIGASTPGRRIYVYDVQNGKADDLASSLSRILSIGVETSAPSSSRYERARDSDAASPPSLREIDAVSPDVSGGSSGPAGALKIVPNVENNALLLYATPSEFSVIEAALRRLDVMPIQVLIEASLAEVSLTDDLRYGLQWVYQGGDGPLVLSEAANGSINPRFPGFSYLFTGSANIRAVLNALEAVTDVNVLSSPKLLVLNNREAELQIGDQVPIVVQSAVSTVDGSAPIVNAVQLRDTGVILRITPRVNKGGMVLLDVAQEVSDVVPTTTSNIDSPTIQQRRIASSIAVRSGETIALGGLIRDSSSRSRVGVPLASRIPLIGALFGTTTKNRRRTELIVLITPRVLRSQQESQDLMDELREQFKGLRGTLLGWSEAKPEEKNVGTVPSTDDNGKQAQSASGPKD